MISVHIEIWSVNSAKPRLPRLSERRPDDGCPQETKLASALGEPDNRASDSRTGLGWVAWNGSRP